MTVTGAEPPWPLRVGGLDPSLESFGMAVAGDRELVPLLYRVTPGRRRGHERIDYLLEAVSDYMSGCDVVLVEGVLANMPGAEAHLNLAGLHWLVRHRLYRLGVPYAVVTPKTRSKFLTGNGSASKELCLVTAIRRLGVLFPAGEDEPADGGPIDGTDKADALTLAAMCAQYYGQPLVPMPADRVALLTATKLVKHRGREATREPVITWPEIPLEGRARVQAAVLAEDEKRRREWLASRNPEDPFEAAPF